MPNRHFLVKFWKCQKVVSILPREAKALLEVFWLQPIVFGLRQNSSSSSFASWGKIKMHDFILADEDWIGLMIFKYLRIRTGSDSILSDRTGLGLKNFTVRSSLVPCYLWAPFTSDNVFACDAISNPATRLGLSLVNRLWNHIYETWSWRSQV